MKTNTMTVATTETPIGTLNAEYAHWDVRAAERAGNRYSVAIEHAAAILARNPGFCTLPAGEGFVTVYSDATSRACAVWLAKRAGKKVAL
jgi:hypothetical protein